MLKRRTVPISLVRKREDLAWELHAKHYSLSRIVAAFEEAGLGTITTQGIWKIIRRVEVRALENQKAKVVSVKMQQTSALEWQVRELVDEWERSKGPGRMVRKQTTPPVLPSGGITGPLLPSSEKVTQEVREQCGDSRYLDSARAAMADIRKIWGANEPEKTDITTNGQPIDSRPNRVELNFNIVQRELEDEHDDEGNGTVIDRVNGHHS